MSTSYLVQRHRAEATENATPLPSLLHPLARRRARRVQRARQVSNQCLAWRVQDILAACNLTQSDYSIAGGRVVHIPQVVSVITGPPVGLVIRLLPCQLPKDFAALAPRMAYHLGMARVRIVSLQPPFIRMDLLSQADQAIDDRPADGSDGVNVELDRRRRPRCRVPSQPQDKKPRIATNGKAESVTSRLDLQYGPDTHLNNHRASEELRVQIADMSSSEVGGPAHPSSNGRVFR